MGVSCVVNRTMHAMEGAVGEYKVKEGGMERRKVVQHTQKSSRHAIQNLCRRVRAGTSINHNAVMLERKQQNHVKENHACRHRMEGITGNEASLSQSAMLPHPFCSLMMVSPETCPPLGICLSCAVV